MCLPAGFEIALTATSDTPARTEGRKSTLAKEGWTSKDIYQQTASTLHQSEAVVALDQAAIDKAQLNLSRTVVRSPVNGYVTNLLAQLGDYANVGQKIISAVDAHSFWIDGYFEESSRRKIASGRSGDRQADGLRPARSWPCRRCRPWHQRPERADGSDRARIGKSDLHLVRLAQRRASTHPPR